MARFVRWFIFLALVGLAAFYFITRPQTVDAARFDALSGDADRGALVFHAAGCASCHAAPKAEASDMPLLTGGQAFPSDFGTFYAPNISPDPEVGIGGWDVADLANALTKGVSPEGQHYYPAFPYLAYSKMTDQDIVDLKAFMDDLPVSDTASRAHEVGFPFNIRRSLGGWKFLFFNDDWVMDAADTPQLERGRYLVEALAHCGECHTPRGPLGDLQYDAWLTGAELPGEGKIPGISPGTLSWSENDIAFYLESGFTPDFDSVGGAMAHVVENMARLSAEDRAAIAAYLKALPET
ncbi:cytochrome c [Cognatishimia sp. SS12]|uniref:cytochrome c n=1 Tax=Cognatishimia sp. SS12 TaxID=2979465 RepID=UPI00232ED2D2|nr:cytochrome c [Cognatishimia sp. SS12]MDC0737105.1 cytochrome c [Cognatishimia sp. SS12]